MSRRSLCAVLRISKEGKKKLKSKKNKKKVKENIYIYACLCMRRTDAAVEGRTVLRQRINRRTRRDFHKLW